MFWWFLPLFLQIYCSSDVIDWVVVSLNQQPTVVVELDIRTETFLMTWDVLTSGLNTSASWCSLTCFIWCSSRSPDFPLCFSLCRSVVASFWASPSTWRSTKMDTRWGTRSGFGRKTFLTFLTALLKTSDLSQTRTSKNPIMRSNIQGKIYFENLFVFRLQLNLCQASTWWSPSASSSWYSASWAAAAPSERTAACCCWWDQSSPLIPLTS